MSYSCSFTFVSVDLKNCHLFQISLVGFIKVGPLPVGLLRYSGFLKWVLCWEDDPARKVLVTRAWGPEFHP